MAAVTPEHLAAFDQRGWFVLPSVLSQEDVEMLRLVADDAVAARDSGNEANADFATHAADKQLLEASSVGKYFFFMQEDVDHRMRRVLFGEPIAAIVNAVLGDAVYLHSELVIKAAAGARSKSLSDTAFSWHQDSGYVMRDDGVTPLPHQPYLSCWICLDDMSLANGTVRMLDHDDAPKDKVAWEAPTRPASGMSRPCYRHEPIPGSPDLAGYDGPLTGTAVEFPAGSIAVFSSLTLHASGGNTTQAPRRALNLQYSPGPLYREDGVTPQTAGELVGKPITENGKRSSFAQEIASKN